MPPTTTSQKILRPMKGAPLASFQLLGSPLLFGDASGKTLSGEPPSGDHELGVSVPSAMRSAPGVEKRLLSEGPTSLGRDRRASLSAPGSRISRMIPYAPTGSPPR